MKSTPVKLALLITAIAAQAILYSGCASGMTRTVSNATAPIRVSPEHPVSGITVSLAPEVQEKLKDSFKFDQEALRRTVELALNNNQLFAHEPTDAGVQLSILVTHVRVRSTFNAVMWGMMSGNDSVQGEVVVKDSAGNKVDSFKVNASYALGGWAGGQDSMRINWLYESFAKEVVHAFIGEPKK